MGLEPVRHAGEFWIDVGGTFTDCYLRTAEGELRRCKVLSSGRTRGAGEMRGDCLIDPSRGHEPGGLWNGCSITLERPDGLRLSNVIVRSEGAVLELRDRGDATAHVRYEIESGEEAPLTGIRR
ncbi:MAG: hypothetical protein KDB05_32230, partial [Planctomycetales bacterium]|nr:hypothetical protein [Planctomycetales bacterium]